jgi:hypothetical protein
MIHVIKQAQEFFDHSLSGAKPFEIRLNDREYAWNDTVLMRELSPWMMFTGRWATFPITFILSDPKWGMQDNYVILGLGSIIDRGNSDEWLHHPLYRDLVSPSEITAFSK